MIPSNVPSPEPVSGTAVTPATSFAARVVLEQAVRLDPGSVQAWSQLATCYISDYKNRWNEAGNEEIGAGLDLIRRAREALLTADEIDPKLAQSRYAEGFIRCVKGRHHEGYEAMDRATRPTRTSPPHTRKKPISWSASEAPRRRCRLHIMRSNSLVPMTNPPGFSIGCSDAPTSCSKTTARRSIGCSDRSMREEIFGSAVQTWSLPMRLPGASQRHAMRCVNSTNGGSAGTRRGTSPRSSRRNFPITTTCVIKNYSAG